MWNHIPELYILNILLYTLLCIQVHFSISHPIQRICPSYLMLVNSTCGLFHHFPHFFFTVVAGWAKPQQPGKQSGCTALSGKQEGVWEEGDGHRGAELGGRLSFSTSLLLPLHPPLIIPVLQSFIFTSSRKKKHSNFIRRTQVPPWKKKEDWNNQTRMDINLLANTFKENQGGEINLIFVFLFFNAWCEISYC